ncbi:MAG: alpha/beta fold hydrolase, partial [bacterium]|nr:alpha/beta fold hydrolase [bacterium]
MRTELVSVPTDTVPLEGAYYEPEGSAITGCAILLHGNCMNFYVGAPRFLPPHLTGMGLACLAFNRRGHDVLSTRDSRELEGGAFQTTAEAIADNNHARAWIEAKGYGPPAVIGHSNGGLLSVRHVADHPDTPAMVLLSAHRGGKGIAGLASANGLWAQNRLAEISELARDLLAEGRGSELILLPGWWRATTAESAGDYLENMPD